MNHSANWQGMQLETKGANKGPHVLSMAQSLRQIHAGVLQLLLQQIVGVLQEEYRHFK